MSETQTFPRVLPAQSHPLASSSAKAVSIPWTIWCIVAGIFTGLVGGTWDFAWHRSIGRDAFWTPPHFLVQSAAVLVFVACAYEIVTTSLADDSLRRDASVQVLGLRGPSGAFIGFWGSVAMVASAPFDNWWHNAYGLDVQFITPPHGLLSLGYFATKIGAMIWIARMMNGSQEALARRLAWLLLIVGSICVSLLWILIMPLTMRINMHTAACYLAIAFAFPTMMIATARGSGHKWGCTIVAAIYTGIGVGSEWLLPLVPAQPKLGPVYHNVTHLVPLQFPLLMLVPALVADLLLQKLEQRSSWTKSLYVGPMFILSFLAAQWPFANFLMSPASRNWIFGTAYFSYFDPAGFLYNPYQFRVAEKTPGAFILVLVAALLISIVTTRFGLDWGDWMQRVRR